MNRPVVPTSVALDLEIARFLYVEAALLDDRRWDDWLAMWTDDAQYVMPTRSEVMADDAWGRPLEGSFAERAELQYFDEPKLLLDVRVLKLKTGKAWAEQPPSHTTRLITNVHVLDESDRGVSVHSNFLVHRTRGETRTEQFVGTRRDLLQRTDDDWRIAGRTVFLNAGVLLSSNLELFF
jgi:3-phenylpropionate/cinnamic acid dioxygenase small subunit